MNIRAAIRATYLLYERETGYYFSTPTAYIVMAVFLLICGYLFAAPFFIRGQSDIETFLRSAPLILTFFVPAVTMRLIAEEHKTGTAELLAALPVCEWQIIAAKYLAALTLSFAAILLTALYPVTVTVIGNPDTGTFLTAYAGLLLTETLFCAAGLFASALTKNQITAFIIGFLFCFALFISGKVAAVLPPGIAELADFAGIDSHAEALNRGVLDSRDMIYFLSTALLFLFFTNLKLVAARHK